MQTQSKTSKRSKKIVSKKNVVPEARKVLNRFKIEAASEVGVNLKQGYKSDLTSRQAGSVGGNMRKKRLNPYELWRLIDVVV